MASIRNHGIIYDIVMGALTLLVSMVCVVPALSGCSSSSSSNTSSATTEAATTTSATPAKVYAVGSDIKAGPVRLAYDASGKTGSLGTQSWAIYASADDAAAANSPDATSDDIMKELSAYSVAKDGTSWIVVSDGQFLVTAATVTASDGVADAQATSTSSPKDNYYLVGKELVPGTYTITSNGGATYNGTDMGEAMVYDDPNDPANATATIDASKGSQTVTVQDGQFLELLGCDATLS